MVFPSFHPFKAENYFSLIFSTKFGRPNTLTLDLVSEDPINAKSWVRTLNRILNATKSIEMQKEYELYLRDQFQMADKDSSGTLTLSEFAKLVQQLNIALTEKEILDIFDSCNTNRKPDEDGEQVIDEHEL